MIIHRLRMDTIEVNFFFLDLAPLSQQSFEGGLETETKSMTSVEFGFLREKFTLGPTFKFSHPSSFSKIAIFFPRLSMTILLDIRVKYNRTDFKFLCSKTQLFFYGNKNC